MKPRGGDSTVVGQQVFGEKKRTPPYPRNSENSLKYFSGKITKSYCLPGCWASWLKPSRGQPPASSGVIKRDTDPLVQRLDPYGLAGRERMASEEKKPDSWPGGLHLKSPPYTLHSSLEFMEPPTSNRKLVIVMVGAMSALTISVVGVLVATYLGRAACIQRDAYSFLPPQVNVQNEASLLLALSELGEQGAAPGITCDLRNHLMVYHGQPEGCVARKMEASESLPSCKELESYFQGVLKNATLGISTDVQIVGTGSLGSLASLLCSNKPTYLVSSFAPSPRHRLA